MRFPEFPEPAHPWVNQAVWRKREALPGPRLVQWAGFGHVSVSEADEPQDLEPMQDRPALVAPSDAHRRGPGSDAAIHPLSRSALPPLRRPRTYGRRVGTRSVPIADTGWDRRLRRAAPRGHGPRHAVQPSPRSNTVRWRSAVRLHIREQIAQDVMPGCAVAVDVHREDASRDPVFLCEELRGKGVDL
jgi:hypothetical protein